MIKIITVIGARPQIIKSAALSRCIKELFFDQIEEVLVHTGQHYDENMSDIFFNELGITKEKYNLNIGSGSPTYQISGMMQSLEAIFLVESPNAILLYGDTNSTLAACLTASKMNIPILHVEAGVRAYSKNMPEEVNRLICDHVSTILFVPSEAGMKGLKKEGFDLTNDHSGMPNPDKPLVVATGDIMFDNALYFSKVLEGKEEDILKKFNLIVDQYLVCTVHRPQNVDNAHSLSEIILGLNLISQTIPFDILFPIHPRTRHTLERLMMDGRIEINDKIMFVDPISYIDMCAVIRNSRLVITDSGGLQKEAYFHNKPCVILLDKTPWPELVNSGTAKLCVNDRKKILETSIDLLNTKNLIFPLLYGDGKTSNYICQCIVDCFSKK